MSQQPTDGSRDESAPDPTTCLSFTVSGPWGHFRRIEGNIVKQTYRVIPRTTLAGLVAAMLGIGRDEYYHLFQRDTSAIAIEPVTELRTVNMPINTLSTADEHMTTVPSRGRKLRVGLPDPTTPRQQHNYEVLVEPAYRVDLWMADEQHYQELRATLEAGESYYVPSLGLSEHLAEIEYHGEYDVEDGPTEGVVAIDSTVVEAVDSIVPTPGINYGIERSPAYMEPHGGGRRTTGFAAQGFSHDGRPLEAQDVSTNRVDGRTVMFS